MTTTMTDRVAAKKAELAARRAQNAEKGADPKGPAKTDATPDKGPKNADPTPVQSKPKLAKLTDEQLGAMKVADLLKAAEERGVKGLAKKPKKADVIEAIKAAQSKKGGTRTGPSIIGLCVELLLKASAKTPITKGEVFDAVCKAFPDKAANEDGKKGMWKTVSDSIPVDLRNRKGLVVSKCPDGKGYWLEASEMTKAK